MRVPTYLLGWLFLATGCTGMSLGENVPGGDTPVDPTPTQPGEHRMGQVAVEPDEDQVWVVHEENRNGQTRAHLSAVDPVTGAIHEVMDVSGISDRRVVFPGADRMILFGERDGRDHLVLFDTAARRPIRSIEAPTWYWGTRTSPSGRAVVVADNVDPLAPIHVFDTATLEHQVLEHGGDEIEGMWNHHEDVLLALSVSNPVGGPPLARLLRYDLRDADLAAPLPAPTVFWELAGYGWDYGFSFTWIGISPDDHWAVFPLIKHTAGPDDLEHVLLVLDQTTGRVAMVPGSGPVGFTRDSRWIVTYGTDADGDGQDLWLIDPVSHEQRVVDVEVDGLRFTVSRETDHVVCGDVLGVGVYVYDVAAGAMHTVPLPPTQPELYLGFQDYVTRPGTGELWLESGGGLYQLSLPEATVAPVWDGATLFSSLNVRPSADQAIGGDGERARVMRIDMATHLLEGAILALPSPFDTGAADRFPSRSRRAQAGAVRARVRVESPFDPQYRRVSAP